ncbi:MAG: glycosyltransferase [Fibromonadales bacterium]|nr:glycosyltransferase [Fibromonadales bacterium]
MIFDLPQIKYPMQKGLISIIVPIYNDEVYIRECLDSILAQTFTNWEALLVNDGSTDGTGKIIDEYAKKDLRFIAIHKQNQGTLLARKTGLENSKGEFIANIDHDDTYHPKFLEKMHAKIIETNSDFVWCRCQVTDKRSDYYVTDCKWSADACENIATMISSSLGMTFTTWDKLIKRQIYAKVCFLDMHLVIGEDPVQMLQVAYHSKAAAFVSECLYTHNTVTGASSINSSPDPIFGIMAMISMKKTLEYIFKGVIPQNVKDAFYSRNTARDYFCLDKKIRAQFKDEIGSIIPNVIKAERKLDLKICLFLASKGFESPFKLREWIKKMIRRRIND